MKKVFMALAIAATLVAASACGNCCNKKAAEAEAEKTCCCDSAKCAACDSAKAACCDSAKACCGACEKVAE